MPAITVRLPAALTSPEPARDIAGEATTVGQALLAVVAQAPQYEQRLFFDGRLLVTVALNGRHLAPSEARETRLSDGDRIDVMPPVAGG